MEELNANNRPAMTFDVATNGGGVLVTLTGELDIANIDGLEAAVAPVIERRPDHLIVDVSGCGSPTARRLPCGSAGRRRSARSNFGMRRRCCDA